MHFRILYFLATLLAPAVLFGTQPYRYDFQTVPGDPYNVLMYELDNGLKIYLSVNRDEPRIATNIAVRTGSKNDPAEVTGLAHYLEHMLFKGNSRIGSLNWEKEKVLLQQISDLYEAYRQTTDEAQRRDIYARIDALSLEASQYVATNEYDQMVGEIGARGTNAYTWYERTVYVNDIPANELEKWMMIEHARFDELALRLFHTELEAVYEEFNRTQDNDGRQAYYTMMENLFPKHTYGTQTTIGEGDHLKNPSMVKIHEYFDTYYVPNNMAVILVGDLDPDQTVDLIKKHFGQWERGKTPPQFRFREEKPITTPVVKEVTGTEAEYLQMGYRVNGVDSRDAMMADLVGSLLSNGEAGLIDQNLNNTQKVLRAGAYNSTYKDYTILSLSATPREGQSLDEVKALLLEQIGHLKKGEFDEKLVLSIVRNARKRQMQQAESNGWKARTLIDAFILDKPWEYYAGYYDAMAKTGKEEIVQWANANLKNNYVAVYKRQGQRDPYRIEKPAITPVKVNRDVKSAFRQNWEKTPSIRTEPKFVDYERDMQREEIKPGLTLFYIPNQTNQLFELRYLFDMGSRHDKKLALAIEYLPYLGTGKYTVDEIKRRFFDLALDYSVYASEDRIYVTLSGLSETMEEGVRLFEELLANVQADPESYSRLVDGILKKRKDAKSNKYNIMYSAMWDYALYGEESPATDILSEEELRAIDPAEMAGKIRNLNQYRHKVVYYGPEAEPEVMALLQKEHRVPEEFKAYPPRKTYPYREYDKSVVYFVDYDQVQAELIMLARGENFNAENLSAANVFNQYFGSGLSSIVFQEIRESRALAYSAYSVYTSPSRADEAHITRAYIGTQSDKLKDAVLAMQELMTTMPREEGMFEQARLGALKQIETNPVTKTAIFWSYQNALDRGLDHSYTPELYDQMSKMSMDDLAGFFERKIKGQHYVYLVLGKKDQMNLEALKEFGEVRELKPEEIFGY